MDATKKEPDLSNEGRLRRLQGVKVSIESGEGRFPAGNWLIRAPDSDEFITMDEWIRRESAELSD